MEDNTSAKFEFLASFILPNGILDWFDFVKANEEPVEKKDCIYKSTLHIYLDEKDNRTNEHLLLYASTFPHCSMKSSEYLWPKTKRLVKDERRSKSKLRVCA